MNDKIKEHLKYVNFQKNKETLSSSLDNKVEVEDIVVKKRSLKPGLLYIQIGQYGTFHSKGKYEADNNSHNGLEVHVSDGVHDYYLVTGVCEESAKEKNQGCPGVCKINLPGGHYAVETSYNGPYKKKITVDGDTKLYIHIKSKLRKKSVKRVETGDKKND
ncbi:hypothetical protein HOK51_02070 [Candidatus Woesearchaeota archaeon]|jgi:hypothetical protein|nr:hypothetical protein [Candidatus Woesearchaeota archaeon]MBT6518602.1 hypothetical protein [Candidatus Woesearchaeota archaeon]MBT7368758.1 hypothetical protein [Candidatus Woesearchaeota archaeon]